MKTTSIFILVFSYLLTNCGGQKLNLESQDALTFKKASYDKWIAGIKGGGAGYSILVTLADGQDDIVLEKVFFKKWIVPFVPGDDDTYFANINDGSNNDYGPGPGGEIFDTKKASEEVENIPIELGEEEAILYYVQNDKEKFYKIKLEKVENYSAPRY
jgi:hypothetical protein